MLTGRGCYQQLKKVISLAPRCCQTAAISTSITTPRHRHITNSNNSNNNNSTHDYTNATTNSSVCTLFNNKPQHLGSLIRMFTTQTIISKDEDSPPLTEQGSGLELKNNNKEGGSLAHGSQYEQRQVRQFEEPSEVQCIETERLDNIHEQKKHRSKIVVDGIPPGIADEHLHDEILQLLDFLEARINPKDIESVRRFGRKGRVLVAFYDFSCVEEVFLHNHKLVETTAYGSTRLYISMSLCQAFENILYWCRSAKREGHLNKYRVVKEGFFQVKVASDSAWVNVTHLNDLKELGLKTKHEDAVPKRPTPRLRFNKKRNNKF